MDQRESRDNVECEKILMRNVDTVYRVAFMRLKNAQDADDVMQEVFLRYIRFLPEFESLEHEKAWFIHAAVNQSKTLVNTAYRRHDVPITPDIPIPEPNDDHDGETEVDTRKLKLVSAVMKLPKGVRTAVHLFYFEDMSVKEIAAVTGKKESAVKTQLSRGRKALKEMLSNNNGDAET